MDIGTIWEDLILEKGGKIIYLILDGLGGIPHPVTKKTELQSASKPHLDQLAKESSCGLLEIIGPGITPGSGPGHLALFGYDPLQHNIGRGVFSALGIGFDLQEGDVAARVNFATGDHKGNITDRRAGRIETSLNQTLCEKIRQNLAFKDIEVFIETVSEHRAALILRGKNLQGHIQDTDPQRTGVLPLEPKPLDEQSRETANYIKKFIAQAHEVLKDEPKANRVLLRGFEAYHPIRGLKERFKLNGLCIADYPMYRGVSRFLGMDTQNPEGGLEGKVRCLKDHYEKEYDFFFIHVKQTDKAGEDHNFDKKIYAIEEVDTIIPKILELRPDVLIVTGDHSTPAAMGKHSWHPVPVLVHAKTARIDSVEHFDELSCIHGSLGTRRGVELMGFALAHAGRLTKFGA
ncbi:MAG: 2,3-bisphosphoglycerate-independent phosphoglycerate mutase [Chlamydiales bacterium]